MACLLRLDSYILMQKPLLRHYPPLSLTAWAFSGAAVYMTAFAAYSPGFHAVEVEASEWLLEVRPAARRPPPAARLPPPACRALALPEGRKRRAGARPLAVFKGPCIACEIADDEY